MKSRYEYGFRVGPGRTTCAHVVGKSVIAGIISPWETEAEGRLLIDQMPVRIRRGGPKRFVVYGFRKRTAFVFAVTILKALGLSERLIDQIWYELNDRYPEDEKEVAGS